MAAMLLLDAVTEVGSGPGYELPGPAGAFTFSFTYDGDGASVDLLQSIDGEEWHRVEDFWVTAPGMLATRTLQFAPYLQAKVTGIDGGTLTLRAILL